MSAAQNVRNDLLHGPIAATLLRLAWPVLVVLALQTLVGVAETWFVSFLGTAAVAGVTLVFPLFMLMAMMSNGGIGGGVSSAVARAMGAGRTSDARALVLHALVVAVVFGGAFSLAAWLGGRALFGAMGGTGDTLENALVYSNVLFASAIPAWIANLLAAALRGAGNVRVPALVTAAGAFATLALSPLFIFGLGMVPGLGVAGAGWRSALSTSAPRSCSRCTWVRRARRSGSRSAGSSGGISVRSSAWACRPRPARSSPT